MSGHAIMLDDYEVANLREALIAAYGYDYAGRKIQPSPLFALNTGDWLGQIIQKLPKVNHGSCKSAEDYSVSAGLFQ